MRDGTLLTLGVAGALAAAAGLARRGSRAGAELPPIGARMRFSDKALAQVGERAEPWMRSPGVVLATDARKGEPIHVEWRVPRPPSRYDRELGLIGDRVIRCWFAPEDLERVGSAARSARRGSGSAPEEWVGGWGEEFDNETINDRELKARAEPLLADVLAWLRALHWTHWTSHWQVSGQNFYGDHLLFERLYTEKLTGQIDGMGERMVALLGRDSVSDRVTQPRMARHVAELAKIEDPLRRALSGENRLQESIRKARKGLEPLGMLSLGLDDFLMGVASEHDTNVYLLQQRLAK